MTPGEQPASFASADFRKTSPPPAAASARTRAGVIRRGVAPVRRTPSRAVSGAAWKGARIAMRSTMPRALMLQRATQSMNSRKDTPSGGKSSRDVTLLRFCGRLRRGPHLPDQSDGRARPERRLDEGAGREVHPGRDAIGKGAVERNRHQDVGDALRGLRLVFGVHRGR